MSKTNIIRKTKLGMPIGTAMGRLKKMIMFDLLKKLVLNKCFRCGELIKDFNDLSIDHKKTWLHSILLR